MDTLFSGMERAAKKANAPLAARVRPTTLDGYVGQEDAVGQGSWLRKAIEHDTLSSVLLYGPAGTGKTTLARIIAHTTHAEFVEVSAITGTVKDLRREIEAAESRLLTAGRRTILFIDEIHRFTRSQQDALLHAVEDRIVVLIGATTENPYYSLNKALLTRMIVFNFEKLSEDNIFELLLKIREEENITIKDEVLRFLSTISDGDARVGINYLETIITADFLDKSIEELSELLNVKVFADRYDAISAMIKSVRGSDPDAAVYWMSKLLLGGEDPMYVARRLVILASEDIGLANPDAIVIATSCLKAVSEIGMPESRIILSECAIYLALSPKSNSAYKAVNLAFEEITNNGAQEVPYHLTKAGSDKYIYPHDYENNYIKQKYINKKIKLYIPGNNKFENRMSEIWDKIRKE